MASTTAMVGNTVIASFLIMLPPPFDAKTNIAEAERKLGRVAGGCYRAPNRGRTSRLAPG